MVTRHADLNVPDASDGLLRRVLSRCVLSMCPSGRQREVKHNGAHVLSLPSLLPSDNRCASIRSLPVLVDLATRANLRNDDIKVPDMKKDSKISDSRRSLVLPALQPLRVLRVERIGPQLFELLAQPVTCRRIAPLEVLFRCPG